MKTGIIISGGWTDARLCKDVIDAYNGIKKMRGIRVPEGGDRPRIIAADRGLLTCRAMGVKPDYIVGDFDSAGEEVLRSYVDDPQIVIRRFRPEKDLTDTQIAMELALECGWEEICILGGTGNRLDHVIGNIQMMSLAAEKNAQAIILDAHNRARIVTQGITIAKNEQWGRFVSMHAFGGNVSGLTLEGFKYPLENYTLRCDETRCISNEITAEQASISFTEGKLLVIESND